MVATLGMFTCLASCASETMPSAVSIDTGIARIIQNLKANNPRGRLKVNEFTPKKAKMSHPRVVSVQIFFCFFMPLRARQIRAIEMRVMMEIAIPNPTGLLMRF